MELGITQAPALVRMECGLDRRKLGRMKEGTVLI